MGDTKEESLDKSRCRQSMMAAWLWRTGSDLRGFPLLKHLPSSPWPMNLSTHLFALESDWTTTTRNGGWLDLLRASRTRGRRKVSKIHSRPAAFHDCSEVTRWECAAVSARNFGGASDRDKVITIKGARTPIVWLLHGSDERLRRDFHSFKPLL